MGWTEGEEGAGEEMEGGGLGEERKEDLVGEGMEEKGMEVKEMDWDSEKIRVVQGLEAFAQEAKEGIQVEKVAMVGVEGEGKGETRRYARHKENDLGHALKQPHSRTTL